MNELLRTVDETKERLSLVRCLEAFNRTERYWLIRNALGDPKQALNLSNDFRERLETLLDLPIPENAWWGIDYHIDSLFSALVLDCVGTEHTERLANPESTSLLGTAGRRLIRGTQEDFDFVLAFDRTILLIEAKGVTNWGKAQRASKSQRLREWAAAANEVASFSPTVPKPISFYMILASPNPPPDDAKELHWPDFVKLDGELPYFLELDFSSAPDEFRVPIRCDENGRVSAAGRHWKLKPIARPSSRRPLVDGRAAVVALDDEA